MITVGVDAGGTSTAVGVLRNGIDRCDAVGPAANVATVGGEVAAATIIATLKTVLQGERPASLYVGAAGAGRPQIASALAAALGRAFPQTRVEVGHDAYIALRSVVPVGPGIVLIVGTGSVAYAQNASHVLVGGHGYLIGDEGSGFAIGMAAVRHYARTLDGRAASDQTAAFVARELAAPDRAALHATVYDAPLEPATIAALAPRVIAFAGEGNRVATKIVQDAAQGLGELVRAAARGAGLHDASAPLVLAGGLLRENSLLSFLLETRLRGDFAGIEIRRGADPVAGALHLAQAALDSA